MNFRQTFSGRGLRRLSLATIAGLSCSLLMVVEQMPETKAEQLQGNRLPQVHIAQFDGDRASAISYTFDDGLRDQYTLAVPMLNEVGFKGTFFVIPSAIAETLEEAKEKEGKKRAWGSITWSELKEMSAQGHEIASHTWSHPNLGNLSPEQVDAQFGKAYEAIKTRLGKPPLTLAFPFNASTPETQVAALKYYTAYRAYQTSTGDKTSVTSLNKWADELVKNKKWGIIMAHAIGSGYAALKDPEILRTHWKYVKSRDKDIWVDTFANIARYEKERDSADLTISGRTGSVQCILSSTLDPAIYNVPLTIVIDAVGVKSAQAERGGQRLPVRVAEGTMTIQALPSPQAIQITWN